MDGEPERMERRALQVERRARHGWWTARQVGQTGSVERGKTGEQGQVGNAEERKGSKVNVNRKKCKVEESGLPARMLARSRQQDGSSGMWKNKKGEEA